MKALSIIVPSYNTSRFINRFFESIIDGRYFDDIEIVIVNDGSTDDTSTIAHSFEARYPNSILVIDKENGGHGSAINAGLKYCSGMFFKVIDGDDYVDKEALNAFIGELKNNDSDMFVNPYTTVSEKTGKHKTVDINSSQLCKSKIKSIESGRVLPIDETLPYIYASIHSLTFKTSIFVNNHIVLSEKIFYEDNEYNVYALPYIQTIYYSKANVYRYLIDQSNQSISLQNTQKRVSHLEQVVFNLINFCEEKEQQMSESKKEYIERIIVSQIQSVFRIYLSFTENISSRKKELKAFDYKIRSLSREIYRKSNKHKIVYFTRLYFYIFYRPICFLLNNDWFLSLLHHS